MFASQHHSIQFRVSMYGLSGFSVSLPDSQNMHVKSVGKAKLTVGVCEREQLVGCLYNCASMTPRICKTEPLRLATCKGSSTSSRPLSSGRGSGAAAQVSWQMVAIASAM